MANNRNMENKPERIPVDGLRDILTVYDKDPAFEYRWVMDVDDRGTRIMKFERGGWKLVDLTTDRVSVGQESVYKSKDRGSLVRAHAGSGDFYYLMKIRKEWFEEDRKRKQDEADEMERAIVGTGSTSGEDFGQYGRVKIDKG